MRTVSRCRPNVRAASRMLIPSTITALRTRRYTSTLYIHLTSHGVGYNPMNDGRRYSIWSPILSNPPPTRPILTPPFTPTNDVWISAHAMENGADPVSADRHFESVHGIAWLWLDNQQGRDRSAVGGPPGMIRRRGARNREGECHFCNGRRRWPSAALPVAVYRDRGLGRSNFFRPMPGSRALDITELAHLVQ